MDFLDQIFFDNTVRSYLIVGGLILLAFILKRYVSRYIASIFYRVIQRIWKTVSRPSFINLVVQPLEWFVVILIAVFAIDKLNFPTALMYTLYGHSTADILSRTGTAILIIAFIWVVLRLMDFIALVLEEKANLTTDARDNQLIVFFRDYLKVIIGVCGVLLIIKACFNQPLGNLLTGLSIVGAALALGAKESLENLIASFIIFFDKPFFTGDTVKVNNVTGKVEKIGLRSTRIRTGDKTLVTVPNKQMVDSMVDNWSMRTERRAEIRLDLSVKTSLAVIETLLDELKKILAKYSEEIPTQSVFLKEVNKNGMTIVIEYFTWSIPMEEFDILKQTINLQVKKLLEENDVEFSGEARTIVISNDAREN
ncbi:MAG: mechanosensitive ion channel domain-containing protein [Ferruginibacter sp.]